MKAEVFEIAAKNMVIRDILKTRRHRLDYDDIRLFCWENKIGRNKSAYIIMDDLYYFSCCEDPPNYIPSMVMVKNELGECPYKRRYLYGNEIDTKRYDKEEMLL